MTYRKFTDLARRVRTESTPDVCSERLRTETVSAVRPAAGQAGRVRWSVAAVAVAACVALLAGVALTQLQPVSPLPPESGTPGSASSSDGISLVVQVPTWYAPGTVKAVELFYSSAADNGGRITRAGVLDVSERAQSVSGHENCSGIYWYTDTNETVCCAHEVQAALQAQGLWEPEGDIFVLDYQSARKIVLFQYGKEPRQTAYLYDMQKKELKQVNGPLHHAGSTVGRSLWAESERTYSLLLNTAADGEESLLLVDLLTGAVRTVAPWAHKSAEDGYFSPTGRYVVYTKGVSDTNSVQRTSVVYTVATGESREIQGQVRHVLPDDSGMVVETPGGLVLFEGDTGATTPYAETDLPTWYRYQVRKGKQYANDCHALLIADMLIGEKTVPLPQEVHAWTVDSQGRYLYYYVRESAGIVCREIATGQEFSVPVSQEFVEMQRQFGDKEIQFYLLLDEQNKTVQLSYIRYDRPRQDSAAIREQQKGNVRYRYTELVAEGVTGLADFAELIEDFPERLTLGRGDGFVYLDCYAWLGDTDYWVEDYRTNSFYFVSIDATRNRVNLSSNVHSLSKDAKTYTDTLLKSGKIPVVEAAFDYGHFVKNGKVDWEALAAYNRRTEALMAVTDYYIIYTKKELSGDSGVRYEQESAQDLQELREFLGFVNTLTFAHTDDYWDYQDGYKVRIFLYNRQFSEVEEIWFGRYDGKPVVVIGTHYAYLSEGDYTRWMDWAMNKAEECLYPSEEEPAQDDSTTTTTGKTQVTVQSGWVVY
ncbi:MAG: hypothetical protein IJC33_05645 [Clostridia bacterium]|nr:hypothetical protein [Clostridia bacterium]